MLFSDVARRGRPAEYALSSTGGVAALALLRQQTLPQFIEAPRFIPRPRPASPQPEWLTRLLERLTRQITLAAAFAAAVLLIATAVPAWAAIQQDEPAAPRSGLRSSAGATGTADTRIENLSVATFVGRIPFVQQSRFLAAAGGATPEAQRFVEGARQAGLAEYVQDVAAQVALPYLSNAVFTREAIEAWTAAAAKARQQAAARAVASRAVWRAPPMVSGTRIPGATVTFYACIGNGFCGNMATGDPVFAGAAACSADLPFGTRFTIGNDPTGRVFVCLDRGLLAPTWVDVWFYDAADGWAWQSLVGTRSDITIIE